MVRVPPTIPHVVVLPTHARTSFSLLCRHKACPSMYHNSGVACGTRTRVLGVRVRDPSQLDERDSIFEASAGIEPAHGGFAVRCLPSWLRRRYRPPRRGSNPHPAALRDLFGNALPYPAHRSTRGLRRFPGRARCIRNRHLTRSRGRCCPLGTVFVFTVLVPLSYEVAPAEGLEPPTSRLTAGRSTD